MDDKQTLRCATDCALNDPEMSHTHDGASADASLPDEFDSLLAVAAPEPPGVDGDTPATADAAPTVVAPAGDTGEVSAGQIIEALLFSSDAPLSAVRLADLLGTATPSLVRKHIAALNEKYARAGLSFRIEAIARGYQMMTLPTFQPWVARLNRQCSETRLSTAALETLAIIAYKQPVIRANVEAIRGVGCGEVIGRLRDMGLVRVEGRAEVVGRPLLYGTTKRFLEVFGLIDLDDLPPMEALTLKSASKPVEEVEPVEPPPVPQPTVGRLAAAGA